MSKVAMRSVQLISTGYTVSIVYGALKRYFDFLKFEYTFALNVVTITAVSFLFFIVVRLTNKHNNACNRWSSLK